MEFNKSAWFLLTKSEQHVVTGVAYKADVVDTQGDWCNLEELKKAAYNFLQKPVVGLMHQENISDKAKVIESWVTSSPTPIGHAVAPANSWIVSVAIEDPAIWSLVHKGQLKAFSMAGRAKAGSRDGELRDILVEELSLVDEGAVRDHFLVAKAKSAPVANEPAISPELAYRIREVCRKVDDMLDLHRRQEALAKGGYIGDDGQFHSFQLRNSAADHSYELFKRQYAGNGKASAETKSFDWEQFRRMNGM